VPKKSLLCTQTQYISAKCVLLGCDTVYRFRVMIVAECLYWSSGSGVPRNFGGVQQIQLRAEGRENRDLGVVAP
jgi:hypothetical protein